MTATGSPLLSFSSRVQTAAVVASGVATAGVVEITIGGNGWVDVGSGWTLNGCETTVATGIGNPLQGRPAFGSGFVSSGAGKATAEPS